MTTNYETVTDFGREFRKEIAPILKSKGFGIKLTTSTRGYHHDGSVNIKINKVPTNFPVWKDEYSRWRITDKAQKLLSSIETRTTIKLNHELDLRMEFEYDRNSIPFIEYETENENG
jgi:hypothetical protein